MPTVPMTFDTLNGGETAEDFNEALKEVHASFDNPRMAPNDARTITLKIQIAREEGANYFKVKSNVTTSLPNISRGGIAMSDAEGGRFLTDSQVMSADGQLNLAGTTPASSKEVAE